MPSPEGVRPHGNGRSDRGLYNPLVDAKVFAAPCPSGQGEPAVMARVRNAWAWVRQSAGTLPGKDSTKRVGWRLGSRRQKRQPAELLFEYVIGWLFCDVDAAEVVQACQRR